MKLSCSLCGGELCMLPGGEKARCTVCELEYSKEVLQEMLRNQANVPQDPPQSPVPPVPPTPPQPRMHTLHLQRKFNLSACAAKAAVYLDDQLCAVLTARGQASVPISEGTHTIFVRIQTPVPVELGPSAFQVVNRDVHGLLRLQQSAFSAAWQFELSEPFL